ncbi:ThuA domain-containing protein [Streptomyces marincola]|uniref:Crp/Fnr family transcriptional regulator n=1 Tax=Streptomyces marincola TaxID=2878388 RepID=A0A1W7D4B5_9ACTN|nr:ThuA domain-containing protein [Streptomyces marincola]ARQ71918.1 Crp/Fnr family transcriptional regulator [Streptomyces marincola]UCM86617.1 ThuA domain-containing protein [Streptomyces marincola]
MSAPHIVVFTRTTGFRHDSIPDGVEALRQLGGEHGMRVTATEDPGELAAALPGSAAVVFLSTSGDVLTDDARRALRGHLADGGGFMGVHGASTTEYGWPWFGEDCVGAVFDGHPELQPGVVVVEDHDHPATAHLGDRWEFTDEWYNFSVNPRGRVRVLATADETTYTGGRMGVDHPLVWCHELAGGRSFYTALGHTSESFADPDFRRHLLGGLTWAARLA